MQYPVPLRKCCAVPSSPLVPSRSPLSAVPVTAVRGSKDMLRRQPCYIITSSAASPMAVGAVTFSSLTSSVMIVAVVSFPSLRACVVNVGDRHPHWTLDLRGRFRPPCLRHTMPRTSIAFAGGCGLVGVASENSRFLSREHFPVSLASLPPSLLRARQLSEHHTLNRAQGILRSRGGWAVFESTCGRCLSRT